MGAWGIDLTGAQQKKNIGTKSSKSLRNSLKIAGNDRKTKEKVEKRVSVHEKTNSTQRKQCYINMNNMTMNHHDNNKNHQNHGDFYPCLKKRRLKEISKMPVPNQMPISIQIPTTMKRTYVFWRI